MKKKMCSRKANAYYYVKGRKGAWSVVRPLQIYSDATVCMMKSAAFFICPVHAVKLKRGMKRLKKHSYNVSTLMRFVTAVNE